MPKKSIYDPRYRLMVKLLREEREHANVTQAEVAQRIGRSHAQVSRWENCRLRVDMRDLDEYLSAIGVDLIAFTTQWKGLADGLEHSDVEVKLGVQKRAKPHNRNLH